MLLELKLIQLYDADTSKIAQCWIIKYPCSLVPDSFSSVAAMGLYT